MALCLSTDGKGFGGGYSSTQLPHLLTTFAAVNAVAVIGTDEAYQLLDPMAMYDYLSGIKLPNGSFKVCIGGEHDIR